MKNTVNKELLNYLLNHRQPIAIKNRAVNMFIFEMNCLWFIMIFMNKQNVTRLLRNIEYTENFIFPRNHVAFILYIFCLFDADRVDYFALY